jgi:ABC-type uncharacterized transport system permease subunit
MIMTKREKICVAFAVLLTSMAVIWYCFSDLFLSNKTFQVAQEYDFSSMRKVEAIQSYVATQESFFSNIWVQFFLAICVVILLFCLLFSQMGKRYPRRV